MKQDELVEKVKIFENRETQPIGSKFNETELEMQQLGVEDGTF